MPGSPPDASFWQTLIDENGEPIGSHRVWLANMMLPGLAMSRSIGDDVAATVGVHAIPEIRTYNREFSVVVTCVRPNPALAIKSLFGMVPCAVPEV